MTKASREVAAHTAGKPSDPHEQGGERQAARPVMGLEGIHPCFPTTTTPDPPKGGFALLGYNFS